MIQPGESFVVSDWNPHYAGLGGVVGDLFDEVNAIVRIDECVAYPNGSWTIIAISELEEVHHEH